MLPLGLVDQWSSLKMKKYLYTTSRRIRYVYGAEMKPAAVYFKSGSLYSCREEEGFKCGKYKGNRLNAMTSIAILETPAADNGQQKRYIVALTSDVRKVNSAWDHSRIGIAVDESSKPARQLQSSKKPPRKTRTPRVVNLTKPKDRKAKDKGWRAGALRGQCRQQCQAI